MKAVTHDPRFATKAEIADRLGISLPTVKLWTLRGFLKPLRQQNGLPNIYRWSQVIDAVRKHFLKCDRDAVVAIAKEQRVLTQSAA
jgi:hypothetical protein